MARRKSNAPPKATRQPSKQPSSGAERSALYARREAAKILHTVLRGDAERRAVASIKSLVFSPSVRNKRGTFALVCETLKHLDVIKDVLEIANVLNSKWKRQEPLVYIICYDILFGKETPSIGDAEKFLVRRKDALLSGLATLLVRKNVKNVEELLDLSQLNGHIKPRYVRVNTLKMDVDSAVKELEKLYKVQKDETVPDLLVMPPGSDLHAHPLVMNGRIFLQGKGSSMVAAALQPQAGWEVIDACSAPGNKTVHLSALMKGQGKIIACELNEERVKRLEQTIKLSGATNIEVFHGDFLSLNPEDPSFAKVRAILLDPSCSGSGTITDRLDHLLPSHSADNKNYDSIRLHKLAVFQKKALAHALSFPQVERVVYSTCSIHQIENEDVVSSVLPLASSLGFELATPFPNWQRRGLPVFAGSEHLLRMDPVEDKEGFFIALFTKTTNKLDNPKPYELPEGECRRRRKQFYPFLWPKVFFRAWNGRLHGSRR
ncbi:S-adenosyl-L-methionine-dependent methyltransferases superfamily protein [Raphanus sativus]|uniref:25S rRNA (Cytosine-C(5))-methyltransferase NSUN5-like n=1 Tax=Raphanus sativus TaxID=3726 RepID=A0A9W3CLQ9_RAPSA|nr:25S rRNA (cytosine-C(5))-methyltransferase NSUN5-like [Raphanus sativus]KAJ4872798.1 S-adenosyl-L-methionine-dependent methyltransferases superfamily protein [Raphanus sativus]